MVENNGKWKQYVYANSQYAQLKYCASNALTIMEIPDKYNTCLNMDISFGNRYNKNR